MNTQATLDFRLSPSDSIIFREVFALYIKKSTGTARTQARRVLKLLPPHTPYDLTLFPTDWDVISSALHTALRNRPFDPRLALAANRLYVRMYKRMRFPYAALHPEPVKRVKLQVIAVPGGVITRRSGGT